MTASRYDLMTGKKDANGKTFWNRIGVMFPAKQGEGFTIKLESYPLPNEKGEVWVSAFVPRENDRQGAVPLGTGTAPARGATTFDDDDVPFMCEWR